MVYYVCYLADTKQLAHSTIKSYLAGIRNYCVVEGLDYPFVRHNGQAMLQLKLVLRGIKKSRVPKVLIRLPITSAILIGFFEILNSNVLCQYTKLLMKAALSIAFFGFLRCGEFTTYSNEFDSDSNLCYGDVLLKPQEVYINLKSSKTDPFRHGLKIPLFKNESPICPVTAMSNFMEERSRFAMDKTLPLFMFIDYTHLTRNKFICMLRELCVLSGIDSNEYSGHSFRIGAATSCAKNGIADHLIQSLGRWRSDCYKTYVRVSKSSTKEAQSKMART